MKQKELIEHLLLHSDPDDEIVVMVKKDMSAIKLVVGDAFVDLFLTPANPCLN